MSYQSSPPGVPEVTTDELAKAIAGGATVIDVREHEEWEAGHLAQAVLIPMGEVVERVDDVPDDGKPVYVVCATGQRSGRVAQWYRSQGIDAFNLAGGMKAWTMQGKPLAYGP